MGAAIVRIGLSAAPARRPAQTNCHERTRRQRQARHLHSLGERALFEFIEELCGGANVGEALDRYCRITPEMIEAAGASAFPPYVWPAA